MYRAECENSVDHNENIKPCEQPSDSVKTSPAMEETYKYHTKLVSLAWHLADVTTATLRENNFNEDDIEFAHLIWDCGNELFGLAKFLIDSAKTTTENVSVSSVHEEHSVIDITDTDDGLSENDTALNAPQSASQTESVAPNMIPVRLNIDVQGNFSQDRYELNKITGCPSASTNKIKQSHLVCELCWKHLTSMPRLHKHLDHHAKHPYRCPWCGDIFFSLYVYNRHMLSNHMNQWYSCGECGKKFLIRTSWYNHQKMHWNIIYYCKQESCSYTFRSEYHFWQHDKYFHKPTKRVKCSQCDNFFQTPSHHNNHRKSKH